MTIHVENVGMRFGGLTALEGVSFKAPRDRIVCIIGPNGAGKTTLFSVLSGFLVPTTGAVRLDSRLLSGLAPYDVARLGIARTFQIVRPFLDLTVRDNVMVGAFARVSRHGEATEIAERVLEKVGLYHKRDFRASYLTLPDLKRLEVAKALAMAPSYLLLDEVMAGLNLREQHDVATMLESVHDAGIGILLVEHSLAIVQRMADHVVCLDGGRKIAEGGAKEVMQNEAVQVAYMGVGQ
ncbi:ABC transporter ATP-binding protein [Cupriavidus sp. CuC1]|uniref:ABC transporter ATP-binding protein n=1 Tax=Cupriavidus sp. CuC1 TaxID=3373131 RepID=UPI0037CDE2F9